mgnify:CR=1 FL=1
MPSSTTTSDMTVASTGRRIDTSGRNTAQASASGSGWTGRFTLVDSGGSAEWSASYLDSNSVLAAGANGLADRLAQRFSIAPGDRVVADFHMVVEAVDGPADYGRVLGYLAGMTAVGAVFPEGAEGNRLLLKLTLNVGLERFGQMLALGDVLEMDAAQDPAGTTPAACSSPSFLPSSAGASAGVSRCSCRTRRRSTR